VSIGRVISESRERGTGRVVIISQVGVPPGARFGFEKLLPRGVEVGRPGWERAHSQGPITGAEAQSGIRLGPAEVNQGFQKCGIERFISDFNDQKAPDVILYLTTVTETHPRTLCLKSIIYRVEAEKPGRRAKIVFEVKLSIPLDISPKVDIEASPVLDVEEFMKPLPKRLRQ
jgi:hypothetical protein